MTVRRSPCRTETEREVEVLILQVFVSLLLVVGSVILFLVTCRQRDFDHADRLALLPVEDERPSAEGTDR